MSIYLETANKQIEKGVVGLDTIKSNLAKHYLELDKQEWTKAKQSEYDTLFKTVKVSIDEVLDEDGNVISEASSYFDYIEDCISFNDWLNETKTVLVGTETREDDNGVVYEKEIFEEQLIRVYTPSDVTTKVNEYISTNAMYLKQQKEEALKTLDITTLANGLKFYTDDKSLIDLMIADREAEKLGATDADATLWKTPDGIRQVTISDIRNAISTRLANKAKIVGVN